MSLAKIYNYIDRLCKPGETPNNILVAFTDFANYMMANPQILASTPVLREEMRRKAYEVHAIPTVMNPHDQGIAIEAADTAAVFLRFLFYVLPLNEEYKRT
jgi:hypothetical protein